MFNPLALRALPLYSLTETPRNATGHGREEGKRVDLNDFLGGSSLRCGVPPIFPLAETEPIESHSPSIRICNPCYPTGKMTKERFQQTFISHAPENIW